MRTKVVKSSVPIARCPPPLIWNDAEKATLAARPTAKSRQHRELIRGSVFVHGRRTSISLEPLMWDAFREIAAEQGKIVTKPIA
jgi:Ribbon-helix-helix domain